MVLREISPEGIEIIRRERSGGALQRIKENLGGVLGWYNATAEPSKIQDFEMLGVTGYDSKFLIKHHRVRDLLEANSRFGGSLVESFGEPQDIYKSIEGKMSMPVRIIDKSFGIKRDTVDLRELAQLLKIEQSNKGLGRHAFKIDDLYRRFFDGDSLTVVVDGGRSVDLRAINPMDNLVDFDFNDYMHLVGKYQIGLQWLGGLRDEALDKHHIENSSHALFLRTGRTKPVGDRDRDECLWMPVCPTMAVNDSRTDVSKKSARFHAEGHVHEVGMFNENTGTTVAFDVDLLRKHREDVSLKTHESTNKRMYNAAVALGPNESALVERRNIDGEELSVAFLGCQRNGAVYKGLHYTYDELMVETRGYPLTEEEADDLIFTDILAPFIISNQQDWLLCLAKAIKSGTGYQPERAVGIGGGDWKKSGFCVGIPCKDADDPSGVKFFFNFQSLVDYVNERIRQNDIQKVKQEIKAFEGLTKKQIADAQEEDVVEAEEESRIDLLTVENINAILNILKSMFGDNYLEALKHFVEYGWGAKISIEGQRFDVGPLILEKIKNVDSGLIMKLTEKGDEVGRDLTIKVLRKLSKTARQQLLEYENTGSVKSAEKPKDGTLSIESRNYIQLNDEYAAEDFSRAMVLLQPLFKEDFSSLDQPKLAIRIKILNRVARILNSARVNGKVKSEVGERINDARWLLQESLGLLNMTKDIKKIGLIE